MKNILISSYSHRWYGKPAAYLILGVSLLCVFLLMYTASSKIGEHTRFLMVLNEIPFFNRTALILSWSVPFAEILISVLLIIPKTNKLGLYLFIGLLSVFTIYIISMMLWANELPCSCGGVIQKLTWVQHIWFNIAFIGLAIYALWLGKIKLNINQ